MYFDDAVLDVLDLVSSLVDQGIPFSLFTNKIRLLELIIIDLILDDISLVVRELVDL